MLHFTVTLTADATNYSLLTLARAIASDFKDTAKQIIIQSSTGNSVPVVLGGSAITADDYGIKLVSAHDSVNFTSDGGGVSLSNLYARAVGAATQKLNILVR